ncbi:phage tail tape measure protein [Roseomonas sp. CECT 9278]|uniref:phage tail tape measure protein n=1 Tax=Roseomonas sp. CECT 9278 TaxID=2845823 RepID=UPI001E5B9A58|nr:phage tail tape measure protein [Roseomonas sp. CECT 9278]CAH0169842.1 hypothetical protein ROS9278_01168 [Roseomonas sp. CECT 9278]
MATADLVIAFDARIGNLEAALKRTESALRRTERTSENASRAIGNSMSSATSRASAALAGLGRNLLAVTAGYIALDKAIGAISNAISQTTALANASQSLGVSARDLLALQGAFQAVGADADKATDVLGEFRLAVAEASRGDEAKNNIFATLGVAFRNIDGSARDTSLIFDDLSSAFREMSSDTERLGVAMQLFGEDNARVAIAAMAQLGDTLASTQTRSERFGVSLATDAVDSVRRLSLAWDDLGSVINTAITNAIAFVTPVIATFLDYITNAIAFVINRIEDIVGTFRLVGQLFNIIPTSPLEAATRRVTQLDNAMQGLLQQERRLLEAQQNASRDPDSFAAQQNAVLLADVQARAQATTNELATARRELAGLRRDASLPLPPNAPQTPTAIGGGGGSASRAVDELAAAAQRLYDQTRNPLENFNASIARTFELFSSGRLSALGGIETVTRAVETYATTLSTSLTQGGASAEQARAKVDAALAAMGESLAGSGLSFEQWQAIAKRATDAVASGAQSTATALQKASDSAAEAIDGQFSATLAALGTGAVSFEDAWKKTLSSILSSVIDFVYKMTIQAAILQTLKAAFNAFGGAIGTPPPGSGGSTGQGRAFAGFPAEGGDGGGGVARALSFGSEGGTIGRGLVIPDPQARGGGDVNIVVNNTAPNTRATATERTNSLGGREIEIAVVALVQDAMAKGQMDGVMRQSFGVARRGAI